MNYVSKNTTELKPGDIVFNHSMRLLVLPDPIIYTDQRGKVVYSWDAVVLNNKEITDPFLIRFLRLDMGHWRIQGNDLARWGVEVPEPTVHDEDSGVDYRPWSNGPFVGYECRRGDQVEYIYLNPSGGSDDGVPTVFLYMGTTGEQDEAIEHFVVGSQWEEAGA